MQMFFPNSDMYLIIIEIQKNQHLILKSWMNLWVGLTRLSHWAASANQGTVCDDYGNFRMSQSYIFSFNKPFVPMALELGGRLKENVSDSEQGVGLCSRAILWRRRLTKPFLPVSGQSWVVLFSPVSGQSWVAVLSKWATTAKRLDPALFSFELQEVFSPQAEAKSLQRGVFSERAPRHSCFWSLPI